MDARVFAKRFEPLLLFHPDETITPEVLPVLAALWQLLLLVPRRCRWVCAREEERWRAQNRSH
jgi:hypothetical protein